ncbi:MAG: hypothetical protein IJA23_04855, partial [Clostridia bacterium]|nr:hypothetical protein [Clostridia bacterium]
LDNHIRAMPYLRGWVDTEDHGEVFVSIDEFETFTNDDETSDKQTSVYSEIVYRGEKYFKEYGNYYVYHYDYRTKDESGVYVNNDFINGTASYRNYLTASEDANDKSIFAYYDTSLTLDSYAIVRDNNTGAPILDENGKAVLNVADGKVSIERRRDETGGDDANYRYITLYAYWLVNDYNVIIDYRDKEDNADADCDSIYEIGSTVVTNKAEIESDYEINDIDGSGDKYNIRNTYFDDSGYAYVLNTAIPNRVGYDFIGWSFFFRDPQIPTKDEVSNGFSNGQLNKYNGLQVANNNYVLSLSTVSTRYYHTAINGETDAIYADVIALYNERESVDNRSGENYKYSYYLSQLYNNKYAQLHKYNDAAGLKDWERYNNEAFGDHEADGDRFIYIFAMWRAQTFTIDVNLNIDTEDLINGYDQDSAYSVGFYDSYNAAGNVEANEKGFVGINSLFVRQKPNEDNIVNYGEVFAEIVSNLTFIIYFDEPFSSAVFTDPNAAELKYYYLADLFAVSTGYYLINWLYDSDDPSSVLISNTLRTEYGYYSNLVNKNDVGSRTTKAALESTIFDYEYYQL